ncbi:MAG: hypothetical protein JW839_00125 [Candidatus Lokiarchaeota archaeon]|nr:hypothetical protein [Candidatus Lokiarchaeota archaeon]
MPFFISSIAVIAATVFVTVIAGIVKVKSRTRTLQWFFISSIMASAFLAIELVSNMLASPVLLRLVYSLVLSAWVLCWVNFMQHVLLQRRSLIATIATILFLIPINFIMLGPENAISIDGAWFVISSDLSILAFTITPMALVAMKCYVTLVVLVQAPRFAKRASVALFVGSLLGLAASVIVPFIPEEVVVLMDACFMTLVAIVLFRHPGIFSFVPYKTQYVVLLDQQGRVAFDFWWWRGHGLHARDTEHSLLNENGKKEALISIINKFADLSRDVVLPDSIAELELEHGVYMVYTGSTYFKAGLYAKRSSISLREGFKSFMRQVEAIHERSLASKEVSFSSEVESIIKSQMLAMHSRSVV